MVRLASIVVIGACCLLLACEREKRTFRPDSPALNSPAESVQVSGLQPGTRVGPPEPTPPQYQETADAVTSGETLFGYYNCAGCHGSAGGGSIGPPFIDNNWLYGNTPANIYTSIMDGRPNGMPSWRGRIPEYQVWELVAYLRAIGGLTPPNIAKRPQPDILPIQRGSKPGEITGTTGEPARR